MKRALLSAVSLVLGTTFLVSCSEGETTPETSTITVTEATTIETTISSSAESSTALATSARTEPTTSTQQQASATSAAETVPVTTRCDLDYIRQVSGELELNVILYCDGTWLSVGKRGSDYIVSKHWDGNRWWFPAADGKNSFGLAMPCYLPETFNSIGMPPAELGIYWCQPNDIIY